MACGTGRFLRQVRLAYPAMALKGVDLSRPYLDEAARQLKGLRGAELIEAAAEKMPLEDASADIVTSIFLFHELPPDVRRQVTAEIARVLKPGGLFVFIDSLQMGDKPGWDGLLEAFPYRFHEPYYRHYSIDDLDGMFQAAGLEADTDHHAVPVQADGAAEALSRLRPVPSPLRGGWRDAAGWGGCAGWADAVTVGTPTPDPSPQGGGEPRSKRRLRPERIFHELDDHALRGRGSRTAWPGRRAGSAPPTAARSRRRSCGGALPARPSPGSRCA